MENAEKPEKLGKSEKGKQYEDKEKLKTQKLEKIETGGEMEQAEKFEKKHEK